MAETVEAPPDEAEPYDDAMLERVALEMAASDPDEIGDALLAPEPQDNVAEPQMHIEPPVELAEPPPVASGAQLPNDGAPEPAPIAEPALQAPPVAPEPAAVARRNDPRDRARRRGRRHPPTIRWRRSGA